MPAPPPHQVDKTFVQFWHHRWVAREQSGRLVDQASGMCQLSHLEILGAEAVCLAVLSGGLNFSCFVCRSGALDLGGKGEGRAWRGMAGFFTCLPCPWRAATAASRRYRGTGQGSGGSPQFRPQRQLRRRRDMVGAQPPPPQRASMDPPLGNASLLLHRGGCARPLAAALGAWRQQPHGVQIAGLPAWRLASSTWSTSALDIT